MRYKYFLDRLLCIMLLFCIFLINICDAGQEFTKIGIKIYFILFFIMSIIFLYFSFEVKVYKKPLLGLGSMDFLIISICCFFYAISTFYPSWYIYHKIFAIVIGCIGMTLFIFSSIIRRNE